MDEEFNVFNEWRQRVVPVLGSYEHRPVMLVLLTVLLCGVPSGDLLVVVAHLYL